MSISRPLISVCIPAYNRPAELSQLMDSVVSQNFYDYEIVICEDCSPQFAEIRAVVGAYRVFHGDLVRYFENETNLGYDGNLRNLIALARGQYCLFMGNDDLLCESALESIADVVRRHSDIGVVLRSYISFYGNPGDIVQEYRYFPSERLFPPGPETVITFFRRSVAISGMVVHRDTALKYATAIVDGSLLYQLHLVGNILLDKHGVYLPKPLALYRTGGTPDFGNSAAEKGKFSPKQRTPSSSIHFVRGMLNIAREIEIRRGAPIYQAIVTDLGNYSYPLLQIQAHRSFPVFSRYVLDLARLGLWKNKMFHAYFLALLLLGPNKVDRLVAFIKKRRGNTPILGKIYEGQSV